MVQGTCSIEGCPHPRYKREWCNRHYLRWRRNGDPLVAKKRTADMPIDVWFASRLKLTETGCREWQGYRVPKMGYGRLGNPMGSPGSLTGAHQLAWTLVHGPMLDGVVRGMPGIGLQVLHLCDNPPCCEVTHLWLGTHQQNMADMVEKGRANPRGVTHRVTGP